MRRVRSCDPYIYKLFIGIRFLDTSQINAVRALSPPRLAYVAIHDKMPCMHAYICYYVCMSQHIRIHTAVMHNYIATYIHTYTV